MHVVMHMSHAHSVKIHCFCKYTAYISLIERLRCKMQCFKKKLQSWLEFKKEAEVSGASALCLKEPGPGLSSTRAPDSYAGHMWTCAPGFVYHFCLHTQRGSDADWHNFTCDILILCKPGTLWKTVCSLENP